MPLESTFEIGTQIILSKNDGFLKGWILDITPLKAFDMIDLKYEIRIWQNILNKATNDKN